MAQCTIKTLPRLHDASERPSLRRSAVARQPARDAALQAAPHAVGDSTSLDAKNLRTETPTPVAPTSIWWNAAWPASSLLCRLS